MTKIFSRVKNLFKKIVTCVHSCSHFLSTKSPQKSNIYQWYILPFISFKAQDNTHESSKDPSSSLKKPWLNYLVSCSTIDCQMDGSNQSNVKHYVSPWNLQQEMHQWFSNCNLALISDLNLLQYWTSHTTMDN